MAPPHLPAFTENHLKCFIPHNKPIRKLLSLFSGRGD